MKFLLPVMLLLCVLPGDAQFQVRDSSLFDPHVSISYGYAAPGGNLADRFGNNGSLGLGFHIKAKSNWVYGVQGIYIFGNRVHEPGLLQNLYTVNGEILDNQGQITKMFIQERGYCITMNGGRLFNFIGPNPNSGLLILGGIGFMQHKIRLEHQETKVRQLEGDYIKGYDRLTNGICFYQFVGYSLMSSNKLVNFFAGFESYQGLTQSRRGYNFDTMKQDNNKRRDVLVGMRAGWVLHLYERTPDKYYFN
jgi:hypothetical protein